MSSTFITGFFPALANYTQAGYPELWTAVFPPDLQATCAEPISNFRLPGLSMAFPVRWPLLLPLQLLGITIGGAGFNALQTAPGINPGWTFSFLFFAIMNVCAAFAHCFLTPSEDQVYLTAMAMDVACTACACWGAMWAASCGSIPLKGTFEEYTKRLEKHYPMVMGGNGAICAMACLLNINFKKPWVNEVLYLGAIAVAVVDVLVRWCLDWKQMCTASRRWAFAMVACFLFATSGPLVDAWLCRTFGAHVNMVTVLFLGSDLLYVCLLGHLLNDSHAKVLAHALEEEQSGAAVGAEAQVELLSKKAAKKAAIKEKGAEKAAERAAKKAQ